MSQQRMLVVAGVLLMLVAVALFATHRTAGGTSLLTLGVILTAISVTVGGRNDREG